MTDSITLSPKHGLNPAIPKCFFCGEDKNEIALLGKLPEDIEAPKNLFLDYVPCDSCKSVMNKGVTIIEVETTPIVENQPPIQDNLYPTGRYLVLKVEAANKIFHWNEHKAGGTVLIDKELGDKVFF